MAIEKQTYQNGNLPDELINPDFIAQIASRIFNEAPGAGSVPRNENDLQKIPETFSSLNTNPSFSAGEPFLGNSADIFPKTVSQNATQLNSFDPYLSGTKKEIPLHKPENITDHAFVQKNKSADYYFLSPVEEEKKDPLTDHANNLASQHNYTENKDGSYGLQRFVNRSEPENKIVPKGFSEEATGSFEPFFKSFSRGLPIEDNIDFTFLYANAQTHLKPENENPYTDPGKFLSDVSLGSGYVNPVQEVTPQWQGKQHIIPKQQCVAQKLYNELTEGERELNLESVFQSLKPLFSPAANLTTSSAGFTIPQDKFLTGLPQEIAEKLRSGDTDIEYNAINLSEHLPYSAYFLKEEKPLFNKQDIFDVATIRKDFPVLHQKVHGHPLVWFDNAATTQKPWSVINSLSEFYAHDNSNIHRGAHTLAARATDAFENTREKVRQFIGAGSTNEIIFVRGTTEGINLVAQTWGRKFIQPGDEIIVSILEHHANIVPWQILAKEKGAVIRVVPVNDHGEILLDEYSRLLNPRTKFVSLTQTSNGLGTILPVKEMIQLARRFDVKVLVDGAQSVAHMPTNVQDLDTDFFVFSGHKIYSPTGIGVVYGRKEVLESMPPWQGGGNMIRDVRFEETVYNDIPNKFEAGTPNVADTVGLGAALDYVNKTGIENISRYEHFLTDYGMQQLSAIPGLRIIGTARNKISVLSFVIPGIPTEEIGKYLDQQGIAVRAGHHCTQPSLRRFGVEATVRPSLAFYNTTEEIDILVDAVRKLVQQ
jgi:cysteine desulfurase / selenocysteine lyase